LLCVGGGGNDEGADVVGAAVVGAAVVGDAVVGATVAGASVVGATVGSDVVGEGVVGLGDSVPFFPPPPGVGAAVGAGDAVVAFFVEGVGRAVVALLPAAVGETVGATEEESLFADASGRGTVMVMGSMTSIVGGGPDRFDIMVVVVEVVVVAPSSSAVTEDVAVLGPRTSSAASPLSTWTAVHQSKERITECSFIVPVGSSQCNYIDV
jgi:hypothetical protein